MYTRRKPHNVIQGPKPLCIVRDPPCAKSQNAGIYSKVDVGAVMMTADSEQFLDQKVLQIPHDDNVTRYGQKSFIPKVNKEFRPPLVDQIYDLMPLSRIPVRSVRGRMNPSSPIEAQNNRNPDVKKFIDGRNLNVCVQPTYVIPLKGIANDNGRYVRDRERNNPLTSLSSGERCMNSGIDIPNDIDLERRNPHIHNDAGVISYMRNGDVYNGGRDISLSRNNPQVSTSAGYEPPITYLNEFGNVEERERNNPAVSESAGITLLSEIATPTYDDITLDRNSCAVSSHSGLSMHRDENMAHAIQTERDLDRNNPAVSSHSGVSMHHDENIARVIQTELDLDLNNPHASVNINPSARFRSVNDGEYIERPHVENPTVSCDAGIDYRVRIPKHNDDPYVRPKLHPCNPGTFNAGRNIPYTLQNQQRVLRPKNMRCT